jgi:hypothetical protein
MCLSTFALTFSTKMRLEMGKDQALKAVLQRYQADQCEAASSLERKSWQLNLTKCLLHGQHKSLSAALF